MKYWKYSLYLSIFSCLGIVLIFLLPGRYSIFIYNKNVIDAGKLFPLMWVIWLLALLAFAFNNVFVDDCYNKNNLAMSQFKKYLPSLLGLPALISFIWFLHNLLTHQLPF